MKHFAFFLFLLAAGLMPRTASAQCAADYDFGTTMFGVVPNATLGETFADGIIGEYYEDVMHVLLPTNTGDVPDAPIALPLDSVVLDSLFVTGEMGEALQLSDLGLVFQPNNSGDLPNPNAFLGGNQYCALLSGTPDTTGFFLGALYTTAWVTVPFLGPNPVPFNFDGYTLTLTLPPMPGCTDDWACNYDENATEDDGSCTYAEPLYDCDGNCLNDPDGDGICNDVEGCTDATACNFDATATLDDGSCAFAADYYDCDGNCLNDGDGDGVCDELEMAGCTDMDACNYDDTATDDDGSCTYPDDYYDCDGNCLNDADGDGVCDELEVAGCTNMDACNYNDLATDDDGTCLIVGDACDDGDETTENDAIDENCDCVGQTVDGLFDDMMGAMEVYPTPATGWVSVRYAGQQGALRVLNLAGQVVHAARFVDAAMVDVSGWPAGMYVLQLETPLATETRRMMVASVE
jgi:hypothetical protein